MMQPLLAQTPHAVDRVAGEQELHDFVEDAGLGHVLQQAAQGTDRLACARLNFQTASGGKTNRAHHTDGIFTVALQRIADHAQATCLDIGHTVVIIEHFLTHRIIEHRIDGEVTAPRILFNRAKHVVAQDAAVFIRRLHAVIGVNSIAAKGRYLNGLGPYHHVHQPETPADDARAAKNAAHLLRPRAGRHIKILGFAPQQQIAHGTTDQVGGKAVLLQGFTYFLRRRTDKVGGDAVILEGNYLRLCRLAEQLAEKFSDH